MFLNNVVKISFVVFSLSVLVVIFFFDKHVPYAEDQKKSLDLWLTFLNSKDAMFPMWFKYYAFQGMLKMGSYDKKTGSFGKRTEDTLAPFPDLNREALAMSIDVVVRVLNNEEIDDEKLESLVRNGSFPKIYSYILTFASINLL